MTAPDTNEDAGGALYRDNATTPAEKKNQHTEQTGDGIPEQPPVAAPVTEPADG